MDTLVKLDREQCEAIVEHVPAKWKPEVRKRGPHGMGVFFSASGRNAPKLVEDALAIVKAVKASRPKGATPLKHLIEVEEEIRGFRANVTITALNA